MFVRGSVLRAGICCVDVEQSTLRNWLPMPVSVASQGGFRDRFPGLEVAAGLEPAVELGVVNEQRFARSASITNAEAVRWPGSNRARENGSRLMRGNRG